MNNTIFLSLRFKSKNSYVVSFGITQRRNIGKIFISFTGKNGTIKTSVFYIYIYIIYIHKDYTII